MALSTVLNLISTLAVIIGVVYGLIQLRNFQANRKRENALLVLNSFQTPGFIKGLVKLGQLPDNLSREELWAYPDEDLEVILILANTFERMGWLVFKGEIPITYVEDAFTDIILMAWRKLARTVEAMRGPEASAGKALEWFQWLAERVEERVSENPPSPAYIAHAEWRA
jgi:hypothetical protein